MYRTLFSKLAICMPGEKRLSGRRTSQEKFEDQYQAIDVSPFFACKCSRESV
jgi:hypothetical protein